MTNHHAQWPAVSKYGTAGRERIDTMSARPPSALAAQLRREHSPATRNERRGKILSHGADRDRTGDPLLAKQVLSQLSYRPEILVR
jgi:hypothetical protein